VTDDDDKTQPGGPAENENDGAILAAADALARAARACEEGLRLVVTVPEDHRGSAIRSITLLLGELGDICYDQRRVFARLRDEHYDLG
jgi:hypothetical protein